MLITAAALLAVATWLLTTPAGRRIQVSHSVSPTPMFNPLHSVSKWWIRRRMRKRQGQHVVELLNALAAELRAGLPARTALIRAAEQFDSSTAICMCPVAASAARLAADVPAALRMDARINGLPVLTSLAAIWQVGEQSGASLADAVARLARSSAEARTVTLSLSAELAGARATARILAGLPVIGIVLGNALGASPIEWLTSGPIGLTVLTLGLAFEAVGLWWSSRIVRGVARQAAGL